jgi:ketosteroid isomerase-like protein
MAMRMQHIGIAAGAFAALLIMPRQADAQADESQVLATVQKFFDSMTAKDTAAARQILVMDATYFSVREGDDGTTMRGSTNREYLERLATTTDDLQERMWDPQVMIHEGIAVVWAPYEFQVNGKFTHCGVDAFSLVRIDGRWKIAGIVYTVERECDGGE